MLESDAIRDIFGCLLGVFLLYCAAFACAVI